MYPLRNLARSFSNPLGEQVVRMRSTTLPRHGLIAESSEGRVVVHTWPTAKDYRLLNLASEEFEVLEGERGIRALALRIIIDDVAYAEPWVVGRVTGLLADDKAFQLACLLAYRAEHVPKNHHMDGNTSDPWLDNMGFGCDRLQTLADITHAAKHSVLPWGYRLHFLTKLEDEDAIVQVLRECAHPDHWLNKPDIRRLRKVRTMQAIGTVVRRGYGAQLAEAFRDVAKGQLFVMSNVGYLEMCNGRLGSDIGYLEMALEDNSDLLLRWLEGRMAEMP